MNKLRNLLFSILFIFCMPLQTIAAQESDISPEAYKAAADDAALSEPKKDSQTISSNSAVDSNKQRQTSEHTPPSNDEIKPWEKDWEVTSETPLSREDVPHALPEKAPPLISNTLNNGGGLGNLIFLGIFFILGKLTTCILNILIFRESPAEASTSIIIISITSLAFLILLIIGLTIHPNVAGMLTFGLSYGMWSGFKKHKKRSSIKSTVTEKSSQASKSIKNKFDFLNIKQKIAISTFAPFLLYFIWKGLAEISFEEFEPNNLFSGPWWFWAAYFICIIFLEIVILNDRKTQ